MTFSPRKWLTLYFAICLCIVNNSCLVSAEKKKIDTDRRKRQAATDHTTPAHGEQQGVQQDEPNSGHTETNLKPRPDISGKYCQIGSGLWFNYTEDVASISDLQNLYILKIDLRDNQTDLSVLVANCLDTPSGLAAAEDDQYHAIINTNFYKACLSSTLLQKQGTLISDKADWGKSTGAFGWTKTPALIKALIQTRAPKVLWPEVENAISGIPTIIQDGKISIRNHVEGGSSSFVNSRHPRTAIGLNKDASVAIIAITDGRSKESTGMTLQELARAMIAEGAYTAINLDGGGSSQLWLRDHGEKIVNNPSDGSERAIFTGLGIKSGVISHNCELP